MISGLESYNINTMTLVTQNQKWNVLIFRKNTTFELKGKKATGTDERVPYLVVAFENRKKGYVYE